MLAGKHKLRKLSLCRVRQEAAESSPNPAGRCRVWQEAAESSPNPARESRVWQEAAESSPNPASCMPGAHRSLKTASQAEHQIFDASPCFKGVLRLLWLWRQRFHKRLSAAGHQRLGAARHLSCVLAPVTVVALGGR